MTPTITRDLCEGWGFSAMTAVVQTSQRSCLYVSQSLDSGIEAEFKTNSGPALEVSPIWGIMGFHAFHRGEAFRHAEDTLC